jgi:ferredoxin/flavodoxin---NADP+ reductase
MYSIIDRQDMAKGNMVSITLDAPQIAKKIHPGQFIVLRINETGERVPLTVAYKDLSHGTITIIFQVLGKTTAMLASLKVGDVIKDLVGPLGVIEHFEKIGTVVGIGGGSGVAVLHHLLQGYKDAGNRLIGIMGARERDMLILEDEMNRLCERLLITTDDGTYGMHGLVTDALKKVVEEQVHVDLVVAVGPLVMMRAVTLMTKLYAIPTLVSLNPVMIDATGMCGCCRVTVGGQVKFACVDGPHFDGHQVDFDELMQRNNMYARNEKTSLLFSVKAT